MQRIPVYQVVLKRDGSMPTEYAQLRSSADAARVLREYLHDVDREHFVVMALNRKNRVVGIHTVSIGSISASVVHIREVFKFLILKNAAAFICGHNHPSGDPNPSGEDRAMTQRISRVARLHGLDLLDHVIIGDGCDRYMSFADDGLLQYEEPSFISSPG